MRGMLLKSKLVMPSLDISFHSTRYYFYTLLFLHVSLRSEAQMQSQSYTRFVPLQVQVLPPIYRGGGIGIHPSKAVERSCAVLDYYSES